MAQKFVDEAGASRRVRVVTADLLSDKLVDTYDIAAIRGVIQVLSREDARQLLQNVSEVLNQNGKVFIIGQVLDNSRTSPPVAVGYNLQFINFYDVGEIYTEQEHQDWLNQASFVDMDHSVNVFPGDYDLIIARK